jgi:hypothetical protein
MKPYGVRVIECPDVADIQEMGSKSRTGKISGRSGDNRPYSRGEHKARTRRYWKRVARRTNREACNEE